MLERNEHLESCVENDYLDRMIDCLKNAEVDRWMTEVVSKVLNLFWDYASKDLSARIVKRDIAPSLKDRRRRKPMILLQYRNG